MKMNKGNSWGLLLVGCGAVLIGATGCGNQQQQANKTPAQQITAFKGDPSLMPANIQQKFGPRADVVKKQVAAGQAAEQKTSPAK